MNPAPDPGTGPGDRSRVHLACRRRFENPAPGRGDLTIAREAGTLAQGSVTQFIPLLERGQAEGAFRSDVSATWLIAVVRAVVHVASAELQAGRLSQTEVEQTMLTTALAAISPRNGLGRVQLGVAPEPALLNPLTLPVWRVF